MSYSPVRKFMFSFRTKVTAIAVLSLLFVTGLSNYFIYRYSIHSQFEHLRQELMTIAQTASLLVDGEMVRHVPMTHDGIQTPEYQTIVNQLRTIRNVSPLVKYIYILRKTEKPGVWQFAADLDTRLEREGKKDVTALPGDKYFVGRFPEMVAGFNGPSADHEIRSDEWGETLSGYAPVHDRAGLNIAVLGVDMDARDVSGAQANIDRMALLVLLAGVLLSGGLGVLLSNHLTSSIRKLIEGTRRISSGDLEHRVPVESQDEIGELSESFNQMMDDLAKSKKELQEYFFNMVQSLVRMLEAKDKYTQGHSERVGVYASRIALKMGYSKEEADMLRKAGELHDIGKLAVHDHVLNKKDPLTDEEWKMLQRHPIIGAEALRPVKFPDIIMASIYSHHERHDGKGYPQGLVGENISIFAQMVSVADAYDAMTTTRPYRNAMDRRMAVEEIRKHSGTQFHPDVAATFIRVLEEEILKS